MQNVGDKLSGWAIQLGNDPNMDVFGRSAFNRYYYAAYLKMRQTLHAMDTSYEGTPHKNIPGLLQGAILTRIRKELKRQQKTRLIDSPRAGVLKHSASKATTELASILGTAYQIRVIADYSPEIGVLLTNGRQISLSGTGLGSAQAWLRHVNYFGGRLLYVWKSLGLS